MRSRIDRCCIRPLAAAWAAAALAIALDASAVERATHGTAVSAATVTAWTPPSGPSRTGNPAPNGPASDADATRWVRLLTPEGRLLALATWSHAEGDADAWPPVGFLLPARSGERTPGMPRSTAGFTPTACSKCCGDLAIQPSRWGEHYTCKHCGGEEKAGPYRREAAASGPAPQRAIHYDPSLAGYAITLNAAGIQ